MTMTMDLMVCKVESTINALTSLQYLHFRLGVGAVVAIVVKSHKWPPL